MRKLETEEEKIEKICNLLRYETIEPAKREALVALGQAQQRAHAIVGEAEREAERLLSEARELVKRERALFESSLEQGARQSVEALRQHIEEHLFNSAVTAAVAALQRDPAVLARLLDAIVAAVDGAGLSADLSAYVSKNVPREAVLALLADNTLKLLSNGEALQVSGISGGVQLRLTDKKMTIDMTDTALKELLSAFVRKDYRKLFFESPGAV